MTTFQVNPLNSASTMLLYHWGSTRTTISFTGYSLAGADHAVAVPHLTNAELFALAETHTPPQSWYQEDDVF